MLQAQPGPVPAEEGTRSRCSRAICIPSSSGMSQGRGWRWEAAAVPGSPSPAPAAPFPFRLPMDVIHPTQRAHAANPAPGAGGRHLRTRSGGSPGATCCRKSCHSPGSSSIAHPEGSREDPACQHRSRLPLSASQDFHWHQGSVPL